MPFPKLNIQTPQSKSYNKKIKTHTDEITGIVTESYVDANENLPNAEMFSISNQLKAGVDLKEVNTKIVSNNNINELNEVINEKFIQKQNEVNDEI